MQKLDFTNTLSNFANSILFTIDENQVLQTTKEITIEHRDELKTKVNNAFINFLELHLEELNPNHIPDLVKLQEKARYFFEEVIEQKPTKKISKSTKENETPLQILFNKAIDTANQNALQFLKSSKYFVSDLTRLSESSLKEVFEFEGKYPYFVAVNQSKQNYSFYFATENNDNYDLYDLYDLSLKDGKVYYKRSGYTYACQARIFKLNNIDSWQTPQELWDWKADLAPKNKELLNVELMYVLNWLLIQHYGKSVL